MSADTSARLAQTAALQATTAHQILMEDSTISGDLQHNLD